METISSPRSFVSTALPYVNAAPHLGFALELAIADVLARAQRLRGSDVRFVSGTDDHSLKNVLAAERGGTSTASFVRAHAARFRELASALEVSLDAFVATSEHPTHRQTVETVWHTLEARGQLYQRRYRGLYCTDCEQFYEPTELVGELCPEHEKRLEWIEEDNWFFRLGQYRETLTELLVSGRVEVVPESARSELLGFLQGELRDLCVSRDADRARGFGIAVPSDPSQVIYVWVDALLGYLSALGSERACYWAEACSRTHVLGRGIVRFHGVYWLALLLAIDEALPTRLCVHGYLTVEGKKISKSGNSLDPLPWIETWGAEAVRYYLLRHVRTTRDGDFDSTRFRQAYDSELANQLGNLVSRSLALVERHAAGEVPPEGALQADDRALLEQCEQLVPEVFDAIDRCELDRGLAAVFELVRQGNRYVDQSAPWTLFRNREHARLACVLHCLCQTLLTVAYALAPFLPSTAKAIASALDHPPGTAALRVGAKVTRIGPLFPRHPPQT